MVAPAAAGAAAGAGVGWIAGAAGVTTGAQLLQAGAATAVAHPQLGSAGHPQLGSAAAQPLSQHDTAHDFLQLNKRPSNPPKGRQQGSQAEAQGSQADAQGSQALQAVGQPHDGSAAAAQPESQAEGQPHAGSQADAQHLWPFSKPLSRPRHFGLHPQGSQADAHGSQALQAEGQPHDGSAAAAQPESQAAGAPHDASQHPLLQQLLTPSIRSSNSKPKL